MSSKSSFGRMIPVVLLLAGMLAFVLGLACLCQAFDVFDIDGEFWLWFGRAVAAFLLGVAGFHFGAQRLGLS